MSHPTVVDLFAGAGGLSEGFRQAGFKTVAASELNETYAETFKTNHPEAIVIPGDIRKITVKKFLKLTNLKKEDIDVLVGGPPCQGFSMAGKRDPTDPRNTLFKEYVRFVKEIQPKFFVMENVRGLLTMKTSGGKNVSGIIETQFKKAGYKTKLFKVNAADFGVPQKRKRIVFIGTNTTAEINEPTKTHSETFQSSDSLERWVPVKTVLLSPEKVGPAYYLSQKLIKGFKRREIRNKKQKLGFGWQILDPEKPSYTISARYWKDGADALVKYSENKIRMLTQEEVAAVQTFPKDYKFIGTKRDIYTQIGNAVPPLLGRKIAENVGKVI